MGPSSIVLHGAALIWCATFVAYLLPVAGCDSMAAHIAAISSAAMLQDCELQHSAAQRSITVPSLAASALAAAAAASTKAAGIWRDPMREPDVQVCARPCLLAGTCCSTLLTICSTHRLVLQSLLAPSLCGEHCCSTATGSQYLAGPPEISAGSSVLHVAAARVEVLAKLHAAGVPCLVASSFSCSQQIGVPLRSTFALRQCSRLLSLHKLCCWFAQFPQQTHRYC
jgi:hypothetical protein